MPWCNPWSKSEMMDVYNLAEIIRSVKSFSVRKLIDKEEPRFYVAG